MKILNHFFNHLNLIDYFSLSLLFFIKLSFYLIIIFLIFITHIKALKPSVLLLANVRDIRFLQTDLHRSSLITIISHLDEASAIDFYYQDQIIFWTDIGKEVIKSLRLNDTSKKDFDVITSNVVSPDGLACDWVTKKLYWTDSETKRIEISDFVGNNRKVLFWKDLDLPRAIVLLPQEGFLFWSDWGETPKIERASMDGKHRKIIVDKKIHWPNGLTIDYEARKVYWADAKLKYIASVDFNGGSRKLLTENVPRIYALTLDSKAIYFTDWADNVISSCNKQTGKCKVLIPDSKQPPEKIYPMGIHVFSSSRQPYIPSECENNNGGCSHLCLLSSDFPHYSCACPTGVLLKSDNKTCAESAEKYLVLTRKVDLRKISLDTNDYTDIILKFKGIKHAIAIDIDPIEQQIYWTDDSTRVIRRAYPNSSYCEDVISSNLQHSDGLAIDWIARNLYWTDTGTNTIEVSRLNGSLRKVIISKDLDEPRAIIVHPVAGLMFWSDWGFNPKIEKAALDGSGRIAIIKKDLIWPNGLALDWPTNRLYWGDAKLDRIESCNLDGKDRSVLLKKVSHPFGLTLLDNYIYWTDWQERAINRVDKITGTGKQVIVDQLPDMMGIKATSIHQNLGTNACSVNNGNCSHFCLNRPNGMVCACANDYELNFDGQTCTHNPKKPALVITTSTLKTTIFPKVNSVLTCALNQFTCFSGTVNCILAKLRCDGHEDCSDESDETNCPQCPENHYFCYEKETCLTLEAICDESSVCYEKTHQLKDLCIEFMEQNLDKYDFDSNRYPYFAVFLLPILFFSSFLLVISYLRKKPQNKKLVANYLRMANSNNLIFGERTSSRNLINSATPDLLHLQSNFCINNLDNISLSSFNKSQNFPFNPPPSLATDVSYSNYNTSTCSSGPSDLSKTREKKWLNLKGPPPTPCSTDICEDIYYYNRPSPCTERSYLHINPPPPSPVPDV